MTINQTSSISLFLIFLYDIDKKIPEGIRLMTRIELLQENAEMKQTLNTMPLSLK